MPRFGDGAFDMRELLRRLAEQVVNAVMDAEADRLCGGGANSRNGYRERSLFPEAVLERYQRVDRALVAAVAEMYATGTSTRKVQRVAEKMGVSRLSKDQVSAIASSLDADIEELCGRPLDGPGALRLARRPPSSSTTSSRRRIGTRGSAVGPRGCDYGQVCA